MKVNGFTCDGGCGANGVTKATESTPEGWLHLFHPGTPSLHFCSWSCLRAYADERGAPALRGAS